MECNDFKGARPTDSETTASFLFIEFQSGEPPQLNLSMAMLIMCQVYLAKWG